MSEKNIVETSEAEIAVHWQEENYYHPPASFIGQANLTDPTIFERFKLENFPNYYTEFAEMLTWYKYWDEVLDTSDAPCFKWFNAAKSTPVITVLTGTWPKIRTKPPSISFPNWKKSE
jgi:acetyl-CoA synthetase